jgi:signal transduction histidine kinase
VQFADSTAVNQLLDDRQLLIPSHYEQIKFDLSYLSFLNQNKTEYEYQIEGHNTSWVTLQKSTPITIVGLSAGEYTLKARSRQNGQDWSFSNTVSLIILPHWYQTIWFKTLLVLAFMGLLYALYRYRIHQLQAEERLRTKIAADLHDDIGSTLTSVRLFTELDMANNSTEHLPLIKQGVQEATVGLRDIIWVMDSRNNNAAQLLKRLQKFAEPLCKAGGVALQLQAAEHDLEKLELPLAMRRDLYLILKEFITNSIKYANATSIIVAAKPQRQRLSITISDNGLGFDPTATTLGNGINNMLLRAKNNGYKANFSSVPGRGTQLTLQP